MADNVIITPGSGNTVAADEVVDGTLGTVKVQYVKIMDGTLDGTSKASVGANGLKTDGSAVTQPVSGTFFQATQPVSAASLPLPTGASTEATLALIKAKTDNLDVALSTRTKPSDTQPISAASLPLPSGAATETTLGTRLADATFTGRINTQGQKTMAASTPVVIASDQSLLSTLPPAASLLVTATAATGVAVTATLPAVVSNFHYITLIEITKYFTLANAASATPLVVTTTNLPGPLVITFGQPLGTIGTVDNRIYQQNCPLKSSVVNTATTIVCPATAGIIWRVNVWYYAGV